MEDFSQDLRKKKWFCNAAYHTLKLLIHSFYDVKYKNTDRLKALHNQGIILLPNHQSNLDIMLEGLMLKKTTERHAYYLMKESLPSFLRYGGGIKITRAKDVRQTKFKDKEEKRTAIKKAKARKKYANRLIKYLLENDEIVVIHIQGKRDYKQPFYINKPNIENLMEVQKIMDKPINFVPLTISYQNIYMPRSKIILNIGSPIQVPNDGIDELADHLVNEITRS